jgi:uncharacterized protein with gpF-like domain
MNWTKLQSIYERKAYRIIQRHVKEILNKIPTNNVTRSTYELLISGNITDLQVKNMFVEIYTTIGLNYGNKVKNSLEKDIKANILFNDVLLEQLLLFLSNEGGIKITSVRETLIESVIEAVKKQLGENATVIDIQNAIYNVVKRSQSFYKWQALRIARTETTSASGLAAFETARQSNLVMTKEWISATDNRTRRDHIIENGQIVDLEESFIMADGSSLLYPGDTKGKPNQVINCRCTIAFKGKRDENGMLIRKG